MKDLFVDFEESLKLKELGFDDECIATYWADKLYVHGIQSLETVKGSGLHNRNLPDRVITAPLYCQAFEWFRNTKMLKGYPTHAESNGTYKYVIWKWNHDNLLGKWEYITHVGTYNTYEEAQLKCLQELIKIVSE